MTPSHVIHSERSIPGILADVARRGITLQAGAGKIRFRPRSAMTPDLAERIKAHRPALLALLSNPGADTTPKPDPASGRHGVESGVLSVVSVSEPPERPTAGRGLWSEDELAMLARAAPGLTPVDLPLVSALKDAFADCGATVLSVEPAHGRGGWTRRRAAELIRDARRHEIPGQASEAVTMRDAWRERLAVCTIDGGLTEDHAEQVALDELETMLV